MKEQFEELTIESIKGENGQFIKLTQDKGGNPESVAIHPMHVRFMAEKLGLVEASDPLAAKAIARLERRLVVLQGRIEFLQGFLANHSDHKHADLSYEVAYATATLDIANEFCAEFGVGGVLNSAQAIAA